MILKTTITDWIRGEGMEDVKVRTKIHKGNTESQDVLKAHRPAGHCPAHLCKGSKHLPTEGMPPLESMG